MGLLDRAIARGITKAVDRTVSNAIEQKISEAMPPNEKQTADAVTPSSAQTGAVCQSCGKQNITGAKFCTGCGTRF